MASPGLLDPNFARSVVLLIEHNEQGALGVVINRPTGKTVRELWREVSQTPCDCSRPVHLGGPVSGPLMALHTTPDLAEIEVVAGLYFAAKNSTSTNSSSKTRTWKTRPASTIGPSRFSSATPAGAPASWSKRLSKGPGTRSRPSLDSVFDPAADLWERLSALLPSPLAELLKIKHVPNDPRVN